jgi:hypothetical protein
MVVLPFNMCHNHPAKVVVDKSRVRGVEGACLYRCEICHCTWYGIHYSQGWIGIGEVEKIRLEEKGKLKPDVEEG